MKINQKKCSKKLIDIATKNNLEEAKYGKFGHLVGHIYNEYVSIVLTDKKILKKYQNNKLNTSILDEHIFLSVFSKIDIDPENILLVSTTTNIPKRDTGGPSKSDIIISIMTKDKAKKLIPISVIATSSKSISVAEFSVDRIFEEVNIDKNKNDNLYQLMEKFQRDGSAKNFTEKEKVNMKNLLKPHKYNLVKWIVKGTILDNVQDVRCPELILFLNLDLISKNPDAMWYDKLNCIHLSCGTIDEVVNAILYDENGKCRECGFFTGLHWNAASGSKGSKIQFKINSFFFF